MVLFFWSHNILCTMSVSASAIARAACKRVLCQDDESAHRPTQRVCVVPECPGRDGCYDEDSDDDTPAQDLYAECLSNVPKVDVDDALSESECEDEDEDGDKVASRGSASMHAPVLAPAPAGGAGVSVVPAQPAHAALPLLVRQTRHMLGAVLIITKGRPDALCAAPDQKTIMSDLAFKVGEGEGFAYGCS